MTYPARVEITKTAAGNWLVMLRVTLWGAVDVQIYPTWHEALAWGLVKLREWYLD